MPRIAGKPIDTVTLKFAEIGPPSEWKTQTVFAPTRWLLETYPFADVMARDLKLDLKQIVIEKMPIGSPAYEVSVKAKDGRSLLNETFEPKWVLRSMFDRMPDYEKTRVTTGWIEGQVGGVKVADERIVTDYERFWDIFQSQILGRLYDHVMAVHKGKPKPEDAPFFGEMRVDLTLSEPDYQIGIDQEQISSTEMLHEEIYFNTIHFFDVLGRYARGPSLNYIGRIIPTIRSTSDGKPGHLKYSVTGFAEPRPTVSVEYKEKNGHERSAHLDVVDVATERPTAYSRPGQGGSARAFEPGPAGQGRLGQRRTRRPHPKGAAEDRVDRTMISAEQVTATFANLGALRAAGLYRRGARVSRCGSHTTGRALGTRGGRGHRARGDPPAQRHAGSVAGHPEVPSERLQVRRRRHRPVGRAHLPRRRRRIAGQDVDLPGGHGLQGGRELSRQGRLGHGHPAPSRIESHSPRRSRRRSSRRSSIRRGSTRTKSRRRATC